MTRKNKWASPLFILSLAVASVFGVSSALINKQVEDTQVVEKAFADSVARTVYLQNNWALGNFSIHYWNSSTGSNGDYTPVSTFVDGLS